MSAAEALRTALAAQVERLEAHEQGARLGIDPEELHQLRVATRRLRAFLRAARPLVDRDWAGGLRAELSWLGGALGPARDLDVLLEHLRAEAGELEPSERRAFGALFERLEQERAEARTVLVHALDGERYKDLLGRLEEAASAPRLAAESGSVRELWRAELARLRRAMAELASEPTDDELHRARIRVKRARYAAELAEAELGKAGKRFVECAKRLQDVLGSHQDAVVAETRLRGLLAVSRAPNAHFAGGRLVERQRARRRAARAGFGEAWDRLERAGRKAERA